MSRPFVLFPWTRPFLPDFQNYLCEQCHNSLGQSVIIIPHNRPRRYLLELLKNDKRIPRPALMPRILTISELVGNFRIQRHVPKKKCLAS